MNFISDVLYWISSGLLVPDIVLLIFLFIRSLFLIGGFFGQYLTNRKSSDFLGRELKDLNTQNINDLSPKLPTSSKSMVLRYLKEIIENEKNPAQVQRLLSDFEIEADKDLGVSKSLTKLGPILGLMGTLIPMGPALAGLASGDVASMAYNMQIAFATTVVGLVAGAIGYLTAQVKQRWYLKDLTDLEFVADLMEEKNK